MHSAGLPRRYVDWIQCDNPNCGRWWIVRKGWAALRDLGAWTCVDAREGDRCKAVSAAEAAVAAAAGPAPTQVSSAAPSVVIGPAAASSATALPNMSAGTLEDSQSRVIPGPAQPQRQQQLSTTVPVVTIPVLDVVPPSLEYVPHLNQVKP